MNSNHTNVADDPNDYQAKQRAVIQQGWNDVNQLSINLFDCPGCHET